MKDLENIAPTNTKKGTIFVLFLKNTFINNILLNHIGRGYRGCGGQPNLGNACILGKNGPVTPPIVPKLEYDVYNTL